MGVWVLKLQLLGIHPGLRVVALLGQDPSQSNILSGLITLLGSAFAMKVPLQYSVKQKGLRLFLAKHLTLAGSWQAPSRPATVYRITGPAMALANQWKRYASRGNH